jgi:hypothetical protein
VNTLTPVDVDAATCLACQGRIGFGGRATGKRFCGSCWPTAGPVLRKFQQKAATVLNQGRTSGAGWYGLLQELSGQRIPLDYAFSLIRPEREAHLRRVLAMCLAKGRVTQEEINVFNHVGDSLQASGPVREELQYKLHRAYWITRVKDGELPLVHPANVIPQSDERFYLDWRASHISDSGPNKVPSELEEDRCGRSAGDSARSSSPRRFDLWSTPRVLSLRLPAR